MGWTRKREDGTGTQNLGVIATARSADKLLPSNRLPALEKRYPGIVKAHDLPLWQLLHEGQIFPHTLGECLEQLSDEAYWIIQRPVNPLILVRRIVWELDVETLDEEQLLQLCFAGTLDGVTALWLMLGEAVSAKSLALGQKIGTYLPPALALYAVTSPAHQRIAVLIFARLRQLVLDDLQADGQVFALAGYDLCQAASEAKKWLNSTEQPVAQPRQRRPRTMVLQPHHKAWVERWRGPLVIGGKRPSDVSMPLWPRHLRPLAVVNKRHAGLHPLATRAKRELRRSLAGYW